MKQSMQEIRHSIAELHDASQATNEGAAHLRSAVEKHEQVVESHERRLDRTEITVEAILEDLGRHREQRPSP
jgi:signal transduction histidine kinase